MTRQQLIQTIREKRSFLCVGLDLDYDKMPIPGPKPWPDIMLDFVRNVIEQTEDLCVAYKINTAFYEVLQYQGWDLMQSVLDEIPGEVFVILDAKRGDVGHSSEKYAQALLDNMPVDAVTVSPYMGRDSIAPFLSREDKWAAILALTSNKGSTDFQMLDVGGKKLYERVLETAATWGTPDNTMFVVGATHPEHLKTVRSIVPDHFLLVPGVGAQGGDLKAVCDAAITKDCGLLVNVSRSIMYAEDVRAAAKHYRQQMEEILDTVMPPSPADVK